MFSLSSCEKKISESIESENPYLLTEPLDIEIAVDNNMLVFNDNESFNNFFDYYYSLTNSEKKKYFDNLGFIPYTTYIDKLLVPFEEMKTREQYQNHISKYRYDLKIVFNENGEEEVIEINKPNRFVDDFVNSDKILKIGDLYQKYFEDYVVISDNFIDLMNLKSQDNIFNSSLLYYKFTPSTIDRMDDFGLLYTEKLVLDNPWCQNDRSVHFHWITTSLNIPAGTSSYRYIKGTEVDGKKKGIPCIWYNYQGIWRTKNTDLRNIYGNNVTDIWTFPNYQSPSNEFDHLEEKIVTTHTNTYQWKVTNTGWVWPDWTLVKAEVNSQGVGSLWLVINQ